MFSLKLPALLVAAFSLVSASPAIPQTLPSSYPQVHFVNCGAHLGSAVRIGNDAFVTAAHIASLPGCTIDGEPMQVVSFAGNLDFAILRTARHGRGFPVNCGDFIPGHYYYGIGFAWGWPLQRTIMVRAFTSKHETGMTILYGPEMFVPGMSGGAVVDEHGALVGIVNARNEEHHISFSRALKDTPVCSKS